MIGTTIEIDVRDLVTGVDRLHSEQIPFAMSQAINTVAKEAQEAQRIGMNLRFTLRRKQWAERSVKIKPFATKRSPTAVLMIDPPGNRFDILSKFEPGGTKRARDGGRLAIPSEDVRRGKTGVVTKSQRPKSFGLELHGVGPKATVYKGKKKTFMIRFHDGKTGGIYQRKARAGGPRKGRRMASDVMSQRTHDRNIRALYRFTKEAHIDSRLKFEETVQGRVRASFASTFEEAFQRAIASGRKQVVGRHNGVDVVRASRAARRIGRSDVRR